MMKTNVKVDSYLVSAAKEATGLKTNKQVVEESLKVLIQFRKHADIKKWKGKLKWEGDLNEFRSL